MASVHCAYRTTTASRVAGVGGPADIRVRVGMADFFHTPVGACRDDAHAPCHQQAEEPEDGDDDYAHRVPCAVLSTRTPSDTVTGVIVRACGAWGTFLFRSRTSSDGRHKDRKIWGYERAKGGKTAGTGSGNPYMGFRRPVPAVCRMVSDVRLCSGCGLAGLIMPEAVKTCEEGQTRPMPGSSGRVSSGISAGSGGWTSWPGASMAMEPSVVFGS